MKYKITHLALATMALLFFASCSVSIPRRTNINTEVSTNNASSQIEALKRSEYDVLSNTSGKASSSQIYFLFFPIGKVKSLSELYENAYYNAVDNLPNADGIILPRQKSKKLVIPLILINYTRKEIEVSGVGISVKGKTAAPVEKSKN